MAKEHPRYRYQDGQPIVDIRIHRIEQLFDNRDPAPFRDRDLDPELVHYLLEVGEDLVGPRPYRITFWLEAACDPREIEQAFRAHFDEVLERIHRRDLQRRRIGSLSLVFAVVLVTALLSLAQLIRHSMTGAIGAGLVEGVMILSWVVMWRPVEVLLYDWIPVRHEKQVVTQLLRAPIDVKVGKGPGRTVSYAQMPAAPPPGVSLPGA